MFELSLAAAALLFTVFSLPLAGIALLAATFVRPLPARAAVAWLAWLAASQLLTDGLVVGAGLAALSLTAGAAGLYQAARQHAVGKTFAGTAAGLLLFFILDRVYRAGVSRGVTISLFLLLHGVSRGLMEFLRTEPAVAFGLTHGQLFSVIMVLTGGAALGKAITNRRQTGG